MVFIRTNATSVRQSSSSTFGLSRWLRRSSAGRGAGCQPRWDPTSPSCPLTSTDTKWINVIKIKIVPAGIWGSLINLQKQEWWRQVYWCTPVILALERWSQEEQEGKIILGYILTLRPAWASRDFGIWQHWRTDWRLMLFVKINAGGKHQIQNRIQTTPICVCLYVFLSCCPLLSYSLNLLTIIILIYSFDDNKVGFSL